MSVKVSPRDFNVSGFFMNLVVEEDGSQPEVGRNSQRCRKSGEPEIGTGSSRKSQIKLFFGNRKEKTPEIGIPTHLWFQPESGEKKT